LTQDENVLDEDEEQDRDDTTSGNNNIGSSNGNGSKNRLNRQLRLLRSLYSPSISRVFYSTALSRPSASAGHEEFWKLFQQLSQLLPLFVLAFLSNHRIAAASGGQHSSLVRAYLKQVALLASAVTSGAVSGEEKESIERVRQAQAFLREKSSSASFYEVVAGELLAAFFSTEIALLCEDSL
jgi:hypothetical protein